MILEKLKSAKFSVLSIAFSILCFIVIIKINHDIALRYLQSDGKTRALFGITETLVYYYQYYFVGLSLLSIAFAIIGAKRKEHWLPTRLAYILGLLSLILIFSRVWRLMI